jgi:polyisoprenoid-binding protein YceI
VPGILGSLWESGATIIGMRLTSIVVIITVVFARTAIAQSTLSDEDSSVEFKIKNFGVSVEGSFKGLHGAIRFDPAQLSTSSFNVSVEANTIDTDIGMRDNHLRNKAYFDVRRYPLIRFVSTNVIPSASHGEYILTGNLTIKKTTKEISFPFTYSLTGRTELFKGQFVLDRGDFEVGSSSLTMDDNLVVYLTIIAKK